MEVFCIYLLKENNTFDKGILSEVKIGNLKKKFLVGFYSMTLWKLIHSSIYFALLILVDASLDCFRDGKLSLK